MLLHEKSLGQSKEKEKYQIPTPLSLLGSHAPSLLVKKVNRTDQIREFESKRFLKNRIQPRLLHLDRRLRAERSRMTYLKNPSMLWSQPQSPLLVLLVPGTCPIIGLACARTTGVEGRSLEPPPHCLSWNEKLFPSLQAVIRIRVLSIRFLWCWLDPQSWTWTTSLILPL